MGPKAHPGDHPPGRAAAVPRRSRGVRPGVPTLSTSEIERVFREEYGRAVAVLVRVFGDIDVAEEAVQNAFTAAVQRWPSTGLPPSPAGWILTTPRRPQPGDRPPPPGGIPRRPARPGRPAARPRRTRRGGPRAR